MKRKSLLALIVAGVFVLMPKVNAQTKVRANKLAKAPNQKGTAPQLTQVSTPLVFEPNVGQASAGYQWIGRGAGFRVGVGSNGATIEFMDRTADAGPSPAIPDFTKLTKPAEKAKATKAVQEQPNRAAPDGQRRVEACRNWRHGRNQQLLSRKQTGKLAHGHSAICSSEGDGGVSGH